MEKLTLNEVKAIELEIMVELDRICRTESITYFLGYGSCLGAVRHEGFIPWDDDIDVLMPREDYERLYQIFDKAKSDAKYEIASYRKKNSVSPFYKITDSTSLFYENYSEKKYATGIWVDVFPLDDVATDNSKVFAKNKRLSLVRNLIVADPNFGSSLPIKFMKKVTHPVFSRFDPYETAKKIDENAKSAKYGGSEFFSDIIGEGREELIFSKSEFVPCESLFEGHNFFVPTCFEKYLSAVYGDWRTLPEESKRVIHMNEAYRLL